MAVGNVQFIVLDTQDPDAIVPFWCEILGTEEDARVNGDQFVLLKPVEGMPALAFQKVPDAKAVKNRMHLEIGVADLDEAKQRILELGGSVLSEPYELEGYRWVNVADPEGNEFDISVG